VEAVEWTAAIAAIDVDERFSRPLHGVIYVGVFIPAMNRWAIVDRPFQTY